MCPYLRPAELIGERTKMFICMTEMHILLLIRRFQILFDNGFHTRNRKYKRQAPSLKNFSHYLYPPFIISSLFLSVHPAVLLFPRTFLFESSFLLTSFAYFLLMLPYDQTWALVAQKVDESVEKELKYIRFVKGSFLINH